MDNNDTLSRLEKDTLKGGYEAAKALDLLLSLITPPEKEARPEASVYTKVYRIIHQPSSNGHKPDPIEIIVRIWINNLTRIGTIKVKSITYPFHLIAGVTSFTTTAAVALTLAVR